MYRARDTIVEYCKLVIFFDFPVPTDVGGTYTDKIAKLHETRASVLSMKIILSKSENRKLFVLKKKLGKTCIILQW